MTANIEYMLKKVGLTKNDINEFPTIKELKKHHPIYCTLDVQRDCQIQISGVETDLHKNHTVISELNTYLNLSSDKKEGIKYFKASKEKFHKIFKRYNGQSLDNKKVLIMRNGGYGDFIFIQPIMKYLKRRYPTCTIDVCCLKNFQDIFYLWPKNLINNVYTSPLSTGIFKQYDYHITFEGAIERTQEGRTKNAYDSFTQMANLQIDHTDDRYRPSLRVVSELEELVNRVIPQDISEFVIVQCRASAAKRSLSEQKLAEMLHHLVDNTNLKFAILDQDKHSAYFDNFILTNKLDPLRVYNFCQYSPNIAVATHIINSSKGIIAVDSGLLHIAYCYRKNIVALYGPFLAESRVRYYSDTEVVQSPKEKVNCKNYPCGSHTISCPWEIRQLPVTCMQSLNLDEILEKVNKLFNKK